MPAEGWFCHKSGRKLNVIVSVRHLFWNANVGDCAPRQVCRRRLGMVELEVAANERTRTFVLYAEAPVRRLHTSGVVRMLTPSPKPLFPAANRET
jgi:hypothetical protein